MDNIYTKTYLKEFLNKAYSSDLNNQQIADFLTKLVTLKNNHFDNCENNYLLLLILTCINKNNLTYQNYMLINEIINSLLLDQLVEEENNEKEKCQNDIPSKSNDSKKITLDTLDLNNNQAVKEYFLQENKHLENNGNFPYPQKGSTAIITSGDNMTIPGIRYIINYIIDHDGNIVGIQGFPRQELGQADYEEIYSDLVNSIFQDEG